MKPRVATRPTSVAPTDRCIFSWAWRTGRSASVINWRKAPIELSRIATWVRSLKGSARPTPIATSTAIAETITRSGSEARMAGSVRDGSPEISRSTAVESPTSASTTGTKRKTVAAVKSPNASGPRPRVIATNVRNPTTDASRLPTACTIVFAAIRTASEDPVSRLSVMRLWKFGFCETWKTAALHPVGWSSNRLQPPQTSARAD